MPSLFLAEIFIPTAWECLLVASPFLVLGAMWLLVRLVEQLIARLFPHWEWEKRLGWLNIRVERRAATVLRWMGYAVYAALAVALYGIVWAAPALGNLLQWDNPALVAEGAGQVPVLLICLGVWLVYLGCELIPKLRNQYEREELEKFRAAQAELEQERERQPPSRLKSSSAKPRFDLPARSNRIWPRR